MKITYIEELLLPLTELSNTQIFFFLKNSEWALLLIPLEETESQIGEYHKLPIALIAPSVPYNKPSCYPLCSPPINQVNG